MPTSAATALAVARVVAGQQHWCAGPSSVSRATASALVGLTVSATMKSAARAPSQPAATAVRPRASADLPRGVSSRGQSASPSRRAARAGRRRPRGPRRCPRRRGPRGSGSPRRPAAGRRARAARRDRAAMGCSDASSSAPASRSASSRRRRRRHDVDERHPPGRDRAGLVEHDGVDATGGFEHLRALDQDAELRPAAGADEQRGRRGETERARAGDDEHRDRRR